MATEAQEVVYCTYHPNVETTLRCGRCGKPICPREAKLTEVGYRCPDCVRERKATFYTGAWYDYIIAAVISLPLAFIAASILAGGVLSWFVIFLAPIAGGIIAEAVRWAVRRRHSQYLWLVVCAAIVLGTLPSLLGPLLFLLSGVPQAASRAFLGLLWPALYLALATATAYARLKF
jgi:DNA-directed RNA polymerase subunit RPC12/RpoP